MAAVYSGSLKLDRVVGVRKDNNNKYHLPVLKKSNKLATSPKSMKTVENITSDGYKK